MDGRELHAICDLAASLHKQKSLDGNFGMGAKVASLPSNKLGMRYRSCKHGRVHEVILCQRGGEYGRLRRKMDDGTLPEIVDVTEIVQTEGYNLSQDWTEVTLFGNRAKQNTARDPYDGDPNAMLNGSQRISITDFFDCRRARKSFSTRAPINWAMAFVSLLRFRIG